LRVVSVKVQKEPKLLGYFFLRKIFELILTKKGLGNILGDFFTNASGHPGCKTFFDFFPYAVDFFLFLHAKNSKNKTSNQPEHENVAERSWR
jgi:hypothetical protein